MKKINILKRLKIYQITSIASIFLTLIGFSYNVYRLEQSEINNNIRKSSFEMLKELSNLEQIVYYAYYDKDKKEGNPRKGWVKVGLIVDLSIISFNKENIKVDELYKTWTNSWATIHKNKKAVNNIVSSIDKLKKDIRLNLKNLN